eukprot:3842849-Rhodomonas_salina.1
MPLPSVKRQHGKLAGTRTALLREQSAKTPTLRENSGRTLPVPGGRLRSPNLKLRESRRLSDVPASGAQQSKGAGNVLVPVRRTVSDAEASKPQGSFHVHRKGSVDNATISFAEYVHRLHGTSERAEQKETLPAPGAGTLNTRLAAGI